MYFVIKRVILVVMLASLTQFALSQESTIDNYSGLWSSDDTWVSGTSPGVTGLNVNVSVFGYVTRYGDLDFNNGDLIVNDTLVIYGNLDLGNNADLSLGSEAILIIRGDYISGNQVQVANGGAMVVTGNWEMVGSENQGAFDNDGQLYILDPDPDLKTGDGYEDFTCSDPVDSCQQYGYEELISSGIGDFFQGGSYKIDTSGVTTFCPGESVILSTADSGSNYQWFQDGVVIIGETTYSYTANTSGEYYVEFDILGAPIYVSPITVTVDTVTPLISTCAADKIISANASCQAAIPDLTTEVIATDNCDASLTISQSPIAGTMAGLGTTTVTITVTDDAMNSIVCTADVTIIDDTDPTITAPANVSVNNDPGLCSASGVTLGSPTTSDNCGVASISNDAPAVFPVGVTTVEWTVTDDAGLTAMASHTVTVIDNEDPTIIAPANVSVNNDPGLCSASGVTLGSPSTSDNCGVASISNDAPAVFPVGVTTVEWTVTDDAGLTATATHTVTVIDNEAPTITAPADLSVNNDPGDCTASGVDLGTPTTDDNCGIASVLNDAPAVFPVGITTVEWTITDDAGLTATATHTVTVIDNENPTIIAPANVSVNNDPGLCSASGVALGSPATSDNCGVASTSNDAPAVFPVGVTTVEWTVTDDAGLTATASHTVTVIDNEDPTITAPADVSVNNDPGDCTASGVDLGTPTTDDNCGIASVLNNAPAVFPLGTTIVTWTVTDNAGLLAVATHSVTVIDNEAPTIAAPADVSVNNDPGQCSASGVALGSPLTSDNCGIASTSSDAPAVFPVGVTTVTWTVEDDAGQITTATQLVTVTDIEAPTITAPTDVTVDNDPGSCNASGVDLGLPVTADNCGIASTTNDAPSIFPLGTTTVEWTVTDNAGLTATAAHTVTVIDNEDPTITAPADVSVNNDPGICTASGVDLGLPVTADNCGVASTTNDAPSIFPTGITTVEWTVTDNAGLTASATQTVTVTDNEAPTITAPADVAVDNDPGICTASGVVLGSPLTSDNCGIASTSNDAPLNFPAGITTVTWTVTDNAGLTATATQTVTVTDIEVPVITACPADITVSADDEFCGSNVTWTPPTATDNCTVTLSSDHNPGDLFDIGTTTVTYTATDEAGLNVSCSFDVTVDAPGPLTITGDDDVCTLVEISYSVQELSGATYDWSVSEGSIVGSSSGAEIIVVWTGETDGTVSVTVTSGSGCSNSGSLTVSKTAGVATSEIRSSDGSDNPDYLSVVCPGESSLSYAVTGGETASTFSWNVDGGSIRGDFGDSIVIDWGNVAGEYDLSVVETAANGCLGQEKAATILIEDISLDLGEDTAICEGEVFSLSLDGEFETINWHDGSSSMSFTTETEGQISCTVISEGGCTIGDDLYLTVNPIPYVDLGNDTAVCGDLLLDGGEDGILYNWSTGENTSQIVVRDVRQKITVEVENEYGCSAQDAIEIDICDMNDFFNDIPNLITPNEDGKNDVWIVEKLEGFPDVEVEIYDRWGRLVYRSEPGYQTPWDGRNMRGNPVPTGSYQFVFRLNHPDYKQVSGSMSVIN